MRRFKPFTPDRRKKVKRADYWYNTMSELARINHKKVYLKEKYWRMDFTFNRWVSEILFETMRDCESMSEDSCMYCNKKSKQYRTHENSWLIHLCLPCLIWDKITIILEHLINKIKKWNYEN